MARKYTGDAWRGPIADAVCDGCGSTKSVSQLWRFERDEPVEKLNRFQCLECSNRQYREYKEQRKAQLAAEPRCEVNGCNARGTWATGHTACGRALLCGRHLKRAQRAHNRRMSALGGMALFYGYDESLVNKAEILKMATEG